VIKLYYTFSTPDSKDFIKKSLFLFSGKKDFVIKRTKNGKPYTDGNIYFSLSHTDGFTVCAVSDGEIGIDAEKIRPIKNKEKVLLRFTDEKTQMLTDEAFLEKWTAFESRVKYFGEKLTVCPNAKNKQINVQTISIGEYMVSICSQKKEKIIKEKTDMAVFYNIGNCVRKVRNFACFKQANRPAPKSGGQGADALKTLFYKADILLPKAEDLTKWSVVACDQYTSQPEYWEKAAELVGECPSTLNLVYPEAFLSEGDARIEKINNTMQRYCDEGLFNLYENCFIYVERTLSGDRVRKGIVGAVDLEDYDFHKGAKSKIRATEGTVMERIPPRVKIRENAPLELPHVMLLVDDKEKLLIENIKKGEKVYDFELMADGGHLEGWVVDGENADTFLENVEKFAVNAPDGLVFAVGDGNHSLATAKTCWENLKPTLSEEEKKTHPARFCLVEIENIHDDVLEFEPIHRAVFGIEDKDAFLKKIMQELECEPLDNGGQHVVFVADGKKTDLYIAKTSSPLAVGTLQKYLDTLTYEVDYIHGEDVVEKLSNGEGAVGFLLPKPEKSSLFETVIQDGALPRKTFSMGEANEKRYYMEAKKIR